MSRRQVHDALDAGEPWALEIFSIWRQLPGLKAQARTPEQFLKVFSLEARLEECHFEEEINVHFLAAIDAGEPWALWWQAFGRAAPSWLRSAETPEETDRAQRIALQVMWLADRETPADEIEAFGRRFMAHLRASARVVA